MRLYYEGPTVQLFSNLLNGTAITAERYLLPSPFPDVVDQPRAKELVDMDSYIAPENPFDPIAGESAPEVHGRVPTRNYANCTPYFELEDAQRAGINGRHQSVFAAAANGLLNKCGVTGGGMTVYPEMLDDLSKPNANFARQRAQAARSCVWFWIVDIEQ